MARLSIRSAGPVTLAILLASSPAICIAQAQPRPNRAADQPAENFGIDPLNILAPETGRGLAVQSDVDRQAEQSINAALNRRASFALAATPLSNVKQSLQSQLGVPVLLDVRALRDAGITEDTTFDFSANDVNLRAAIRRILGDRDLNWLVQDGAMVITTSDVAKTMTDVRVYPAADLMLAVDNDGAYVFDFDAIIETITSVVAPSSWDSNGGAGSIAPYQASGSLVVSQTREVHEQIAMLLDMLRVARRTQGLDPGFKNFRKQLADEGAIPAADANRNDRNNAASIAAPTTASEYVARGRGLVRNDAASTAAPTTDAPGISAPASSISANQPRWRMPRVYH